MTTDAGPSQVEEVQGERQGLLFPPPELQGQQNENTGPDGGYGASPSVSTKVENGQTPAAVASNNNLQGQSRVTQSQTIHQVPQCYAMHAQKKL